jgi:glycosyltransferase involved in cell wall biosynthesis
MSVKNGLPYLEQSINSVLNQSFTNFEFIIVDDGSTDQTASTINSFNDSRLSLIQQENTGVATAKNRAIARGKGKYIAIIDADDIWLPNKLEEQVAFLEENSAYVLVGGFAQIIDKNGQYLYTEKKPVSHSDNIKFFTLKNTWTHSAIMYSRAAFDAVGGYFEPIKQYIVDYILVYQLGQIGKVHQLPQAVVKYRITPGALSTKADGADFNALTQRSIIAGFVNDQDQATLKRIKQNEEKSPNFKKCMYHLHLGRSYLFHNYQPRLAKKHLKKCLALRPQLKIARYYLLMSLFLPKAVIQLIYRLASPNAGFTYVET